MNPDNLHSQLEYNAITQRNSLIINQKEKGFGVENVRVTVTYRLNAQPILKERSP